jgi:hypothetical protein
VLIGVAVFVALLFLLSFVMLTPGGTGGGG